MTRNRTWGLLAAMLMMQLLSVPTVDAGTCGQDVCVRFEPSVYVMLQGETLYVQLLADIDVQVLGWGLDVSSTNPAVISQSAPPIIGPSWLMGPTSDGDGLAGFSFPDSLSGDDILLATLTFEATNVGFAELVASMTPGDLAEGFPIDPFGFAAVDFSPAKITVLPEPTVLILLLVPIWRIRSQSFSRRPC